MDFVKQYDNGLKVAVKEMPGIYSLSVGICVGVGSCMENSSDNGFSHFIEHMMFKGTEKRTSFEISDSIDRIGGQFNAFTSKDMTCYYTKVAANYAEQSVEILSDMILNSKFDPEELERERKVILEEITMGEDTPDDVCHDLIAQALYPNGSLGQTIIGEKQRISSATRQELIDFKDKYYTADNIVVSFAGNIKHEDACGYVEKYLLPFVKTGQKKEKLQKQTCESRFLTKNKDIEQTHICLAFEALPYDHEKVPAFAVAAAVFGSGMSSRLFQKIREENGMAYTVYAYPSYYVNNGYLEIYAGTNPKNVSEVLRLIKEEIKKIVSEGITDDEFLRGKEQLKGGTLLSQENSTVVMSNIGKSYLLLDKKYSVEEKIADIDKVTKQQAEEALAEILNIENAALAIVSKEIQPEDLLDKFKK